MLTHTGEDPDMNQIWVQNQAEQDSWSTETQKPRKMPRKRDSNYHEGKTLGAQPFVSIHKNCFSF